ncbi:hypothetical protein [Paraburkholderia sp. BCC1885]|uniref:hypothetical protein n=1 Tax=Paraburkholderia sp. BCC1885 TaxID=2562669 RepID=UPI0011824C15|nr:hypothetical protein [Paraburkholderia sp. BCC1885]
MPFDHSLAEHWIAGVSLRNGLHEHVKLIKSAFANERCCVPGRWPHDEGSRGDDAPEFQQLDLAHASFHTIAQGRFTDVAVMLEPDAPFENAVRMLEHAASRFEHCCLTGAPLAPAPRSPMHEDCRDSSVATWPGLAETDLY